MNTGNTAVPVEAGSMPEWVANRARDLQERIDDTPECFSPDMRALVYFADALSKAEAVVLAAATAWEKYGGPFEYEAMDALHDAVLHTSSGAPAPTEGKP